MSDSIKMTERRTPVVQISEKQGSVKYIESDEAVEDLKHGHHHTSEEFIRFEEISDDHWSSRYYYILCCILIGSGNDIFPLTMKLAFVLSGGGFILLLLMCSLTVGLPLVYMETFLGRYTRLTNCQMFRMCPIFFGVCFVIFLFNACYQPLHATEETQLLVSLLKLLVNPNINVQCLDDNEECYDYKIKGPVNDTCRYGHISMICEKMGEIRYPMEYQYWKMYRDPQSTIFPYYQIITGVVIIWGVILAFVMKGIHVMGSVVQAGFIIQIITLTLIFILALAQDGSTQGLQALISVDFSQFNTYQVLLVLWYSACRLGLVVPTGYMTMSAFAKFNSNIGSECFIIVACSVVLASYYLAVFFSISGVLAHAMGVDVQTVVVPDRGLYLAVIPEFLVFLQIPNIFLIVYYGSLWFFETVKIAFYVHMMILNLYDYFPTTKNFSTYIWVTSCLVLCCLSLPACTQYASTVFIPVLWNIYLTMVLAITITLEATMVSCFYGVSRLCDDIHFLTGQQPMRLWRVMWYLIPVIGWASVFTMTSKIRSTYFEGDYIEMQGMALGWVYGNLTYWGFLILGVIATVMYVAIRFGDPDLVLRLVKPQFFWGPPERDVRMDRKRFFPRSKIRSQHVTTREKYDNEQFMESDEGLLLSQTSKDFLLEYAEHGDHGSDKRFFNIIGITPVGVSEGIFDWLIEEKNVELDLLERK